MSVTVSYSELDTFRQCPLKWKLAYEDRWQREHDDTTALGFGTLWHLVKEAHYNTIRSAQMGYDTGKITWGQLSEEDLKQACAVRVGDVLSRAAEEGAQPETIETLLWMYEGYIEMFGLDQQWDIIAVETTAVIPLGAGFNLKVKVDLLVRDQKGSYWVVDHKSAGSTRDVDLDFDDQFGLYVAALRQQGINVIGAIHNRALKKPNKGDLIKPGDEGYKSTMKPTPLENRFKRSYLDRTAAECESILADALADAQLMYSEHNHRRRHANPETCRWKCDYKEACIFGRRTNNEGKLLLTLQSTGFTQNITRH